MCYISISATGLKFAFDVKTTLNISDITFYPSQTTHGYDLYASSADKEDILFLNLVTGKEIEILHFANIPFRNNEFFQIFLLPF